VLAYALMPPLIGALGLRTWRPARRVWLAAASGLAWLLLCRMLPFLQPRAVLLAAGAMLYEALRSQALRRCWNSRGELAGVAFVAFVASAYTVCYLNSTGRLGPLSRSGAFSFFLFPLFCAAPFTICAFTIGFDGRLRRLLSWSRWQPLGRMSYSYYLIHGVTLKGALVAATLILPAGLHSAAWFWSLVPLCYAGTLASSTALFRTVEGPMAERLEVFLALSGSKVRRHAAVLLPRPIGREAGVLSR
jgi:peptidoglycan/LPS O-acetylase OafA/YrhL